MVHSSRPEPANERQEDRALMTTNGQADRTNERRGPFPGPQPHEPVREATEISRGPFERRRGLDRRTGPDPRAESPARGNGERRRWGRRSSDTLDTGSAPSRTGRTRRLARRFREPLIGLTLAGVAAPLINAGVKAPERSGQTAAKAQRTAADPARADADLETNVGNVWAEAEEAIVRNHTVEGAVVAYGIEADLAEDIYDAAVRNEIEPDMAYGLVFTESTFRERAVSHVGARGLTQLMPRTAQWLDPSVATSDLFRRDVNLNLGFRYLRQLLDKYDDNAHHALTAYNRGPGTVDRILERGGNPDNGYAGKVLAE